MDNSESVLFCDFIGESLSDAASMLAVVNRGETHGISRDDYRSACLFAAASEVPRRPLTKASVSEAIQSACGVRDVFCALADAIILRRPADG
jgi:hypothetical protein